MKEHIRRGINDDIFGNGKIKLEITGESDGASHDLP